MSLSTRQLFLASYLRQRFSLPDSMIYYITKHPKSSEVYQKMIQSCKHFYIKNPILVLHCLEIDDDMEWKTVWKTCSNKNECKSGNLTKRVNINIESLSSCKLWIQNILQIYSTNSRCASDLVPFIHKCDAKIVDLDDQKLSFQQFLFLSRNAISCFLRRVDLNSDAGAEVSVEDIVASLPFLKAIDVGYDPDLKNVTSDTVKNLLEIPHFKTIKRFSLYNITEEFDIDTFFDYYKKMETKFDFYLNYDDNVLSEEYAEKLEEFIDFILDFPDQKPPLILFDDQDEANHNALWELHEKFSVENN